MQASLKIQISTETGFIPHLSLTLQTIVSFKLCPSCVTLHPEVKKARRVFRSPELRVFISHQSLSFDCQF